MLLQRMNRMHPGGRTVTKACIKFRASTPSLHVQSSHIHARCAAAQVETDASRRGGPSQGEIDPGSRGTMLKCERWG